MFDSVIKYKMDLDHGSTTSFGRSRRSGIEMEGPGSVHSFPGTLIACGINYKTAPVAVREKIYLNESEVDQLLSAARSRLSECLIISTCNRTEFYGVSDSTSLDVPFFRDLLLQVKGSARDSLRDDHFFALAACAASQQLFNVATSIDSKVVGDSQILRQIRRAYSFARDQGHTGKILNQLVQRAFKLGKAVYTNTSIHDGAISISLAAVELAGRKYGSLEPRSALVIGAGETARLTAEALVNKRIRNLTIINRTPEHAYRLASLLDHSNSKIGVRPFEELRDVLPDADIVISSTGSSEPILFGADFERRSRNTLAIDIAVPRDIDESVGTIDHVSLCNIDDLNSLIVENQARRAMDLPKVKRMIHDEVVDFLTWYYLQPIMPRTDKRQRPTPEQRNGFVRAKGMLDAHLPEIHRLTAQAGGDFDQDLANHLSLIRKLRLLRSSESSTS